MPVDTRTVSGRRKVRYPSFDDLLADARLLASAPQVATLGNWSLGQTLKHLGSAMELSIEGRPFRVPWWLRVLGRVYYRRKLVNGPFPPGFQLPRSVAVKLIPGFETSTADGLAGLQRGIERLRTETCRVAHPVAGTLSIEEWNRFHLSHAEMHMSFLLPVTPGTAEPSGQRMLT